VNPNEEILGLISGPGSGEVAISRRQTDWKIGSSDEDDPDEDGDEDEDEDEDAEDDGVEAALAGKFPRNCCDEDGENVDVDDY
jgi:hypothetical protein